MPGRRPKITLDYFPLYCNLGDKFEYLEAQCGLIGFAIVIKLFQKIYGERGYYCEFNERKAALLASRYKTGKNAVMKAVEVSVCEGIFDEGMYEKYGILTSERIQLNYLAGTSRRTDCEILPEYSLVNCAQNSKDANINVNFAYINEENTDTNEQKKEEGKDKDKSLSFSLSASAYDAVLDVVADADGTLSLDGLSISPTELESLESLLSKEDLRHYVAVIKDSEKRGHRYTKKSHYQAIIDMAKVDGKLGSVRGGVRRSVKYGAFNAEDAFRAAMARSYGEENC